MKAVRGRLKGFIQPMKVVKRPLKGFIQPMKAIWEEELPYIPPVGSRTPDGGHPIRRERR